MPSVQRLLQVFRSLMEDDPPQRSRRRSRRSDSNRSSSFRNRQAVALVITFRDLFANGGLNLILEDIDSSRRPPKKGKANLRCPSTTSPRSPDAVLPVAEGKSLSLAPEESTSSLTSSKPGLRCILDEETSPLLTGELPSPVTSHSNLTTVAPLQLVPANQLRGFSFGERWNREQTDFTVSLTPDDEKKTVNALRKVLKWSPRKQNLASFAVSLPKEEEYKAVAVVQNAVNRVKEEQERKKKRNFFRSIFC